MSYDEDDYYYDQWGDALGDMVDQSIREIRDDRIQSYLGTYGDAVQKRIDRCLTEGQRLLTSDFPSQALISSVTATELILRYFILKPILEGAFMSDEWSRILSQRILTHRAARDREILPLALQVWEIDLGSVLLPTGERLWDKFISEVVPLRNNIVHKAASATEEQGQEALACPAILLERVISPLSDRFGFSWSKTRCWHAVQQGIGGAQHSMNFNPVSPFDNE
jgi:hypothetical protein